MSLQSDLNKSDNAFERLYRESRARVFKQYKRSLERITKRFRALFDRYDNPSRININRSDVLKLQRQFTEEIASLNSKIIKEIEKDKLLSTSTTYLTTKRAFDALDVGFNIPEFTKAAETFVLQDNLWLDSVRNNNANLLLNTKRELDLLLAENARFDIIEGLREGKPYREVRKSLMENFGIATRRADTITFTEMHKGHSYGRNLSITKAQESGQRLGLTVTKIWKHNGVGKPRPDHVAADGQPADPETNLFNVGGELLEAPGLGTDPANNINCHCSAQAEITQT